MAPRRRIRWPSDRPTPAPLDNAHPQFPGRRIRWPSDRPTLLKGPFPLGEPAAGEFAGQVIDRQSPSGQFTLCFLALRRRSYGQIAQSARETAASFVIPLQKAHSQRSISATANCGRRSCSSSVGAGVAFGDRWAAAFVHNDEPPEGLKQEHAQVCRGRTVPRCSGLICNPVEVLVGPQVHRAVRKRWRC